MSPVTLNSLDSMGHYLTVEDGRRKWVAMNNPPSVGGAFGAKGSDVMWQNISPVSHFEFVGHFYQTAMAMAAAILVLKDTDGGQVSLVLFPDGTFRLYNPGLTVIIAQSAADVYQFGVTHALHLSVDIDNAVGTCTLIIDGVTVIDEINLDTRYSVSANVTQYQTGGLFWSHIATGSGFTGQPRTGCTFVSGPGEFDEFTPSAGTNAECIDETAPNYADFNDADVANLMDTFKAANAMPPTAIILGCVVTALVDKTEAGVCEIALVVKPPGAAENVGPTLPVPASPAFLQRFLPLNPNTGLPWTPAEANDSGVDGFRIGYKSITVTP